MRHRISTIGGLVALLCAAAVTGCVDDHEDGLADAVEAALARSADVDAREVDVTVDDGTVLLRGDVETLLAKQEAAALARTIPGVDAVIDRIELEAYHRPDEVIERRVAQALMVDPDTELTLDVEVEGGVVFLGGFVQDPSDIAAARRIAASIRGVQGVVDRMGTRPVAAR